MTRALRTETSLSKLNATDLLSPDSSPFLCSHSYIEKPESSEVRPFMWIVGLSLGPLVTSLSYQYCESLVPSPPLVAF